MSPSTSSTTGSSGTRNWRPSSIRWICAASVPTRRPSSPWPSAVPGPTRVADSPRPTGTCGSAITTSISSPAIWPPCSPGSVCSPALIDEVVAADRRLARRGSRSPLSRTPAMLTSVRTAWPLRGRDGEIADLGALLRRRRGALLAGPSGVGKTSLASAVADELEPAGWTVVRVVASRPAAGIPLGALAALLAPSEARRMTACAASVQARAGIAALAAGRPAVLVVDDAQWLDEASAVVLHQLVAQGDVTVLATLRTGRAGARSGHRAVEGRAGGTHRGRTAGRRGGARPARGGSRRARRDAHRDAAVAAVRWQRAVPPGARRRSGPARAAPASRRPVVHRHAPAGITAPGRAGGRTLRRPRRAERTALEVIAVGEPIRLGMLDELADRDAVERLEAAGLDRRRADPASTSWRVRRTRCTATSCDPRCPTCGGAGSCERWPTPSSAEAPPARDDIDPPGAVAPRRWRARRHLGCCWRRRARPTSPSTGRRPNVSPAPPGPPTTASRRPSVLADVLFARGGFVEREQLLADVGGHRHDGRGTGRRRHVPRPRIVLGPGRRRGRRACPRRSRSRSDRSAVVVGDPGHPGDPASARPAATARCSTLLADLPDDAMSGRARLQAALAEAFALPGVGRGEDAVARIDAAISAGAELGPQLDAVHGPACCCHPKPWRWSRLGRLDDAAAGRPHRAGRRGRHREPRRRRRSSASTLGWVQLHQGLLVSAQRTYRESAAAFRSSSYRGPLRWALGGLLFAAALARDTGSGQRGGARPRCPRPPPGGTVRHDDQPGARLGGGGRRRPRAGPSPAPRRRRPKHAPEGRCSMRAPPCTTSPASAAPTKSPTACTRWPPSRQGEYLQVLADNAAGLARGDPVALGDAAERFAAMGFNLRAAESAMAASEASARAHDQRAATRWATPRHRTGRPVRNARHTASWSVAPGRCH